MLKLIVNKLFPPLLVNDNKWNLTVLPQYILWTSWYEVLQGYVSVSSHWFATH